VALLREMTCNSRRLVGFHRPVKAIALSQERFCKMWRARVQKRNEYYRKPTNWRHPIRGCPVCCSVLQSFVVPYVDLQVLYDQESMYVCMSVCLLELVCVYQCVFACAGVFACKAQIKRTRKRSVDSQ